MSRDDFSTRGSEWQDEWDEVEDEPGQPDTRPLPPRRDPRARPQQPGQRSRASQPSGTGSDIPRVRRSTLPPDTYRDESGRLRRIRQTRQTGQRPPEQGRSAQPRNTGAQRYPPAQYPQQRTPQGPQQYPPQRPQRPQRPRQPYSREGDAYYDRARSRQPSRQDTDYDDGYYDDGYGDEDEYYDASAYNAPTTTRKRTGSQRRGRSRGNWSTLLVGCIGGIITIAIIAGILPFVLYRSLPNILPGLGVGTSAYSDKPQSVTLPVTSAITRIEIQNPVGNVTISVDYNATNGTLTYTKRTQATSSSNAATEFGRILVSAKPGSTSTCPAASCLAITSTLPGGAGDSVDMNIVLPAQNPTPVFTLSSVTQKGNVSVQNFRGLLSLADDTGNISVTGGLLAAGSCLQSRIGNVSFAGTIETTAAPTINPCAGNPINPNAGNSSNQPWYSMKTGTGNIDATFNTLSTNLMLDVTIANKGAIKGDFKLPVTQNPDGSSNYFGPLLPNTQPTAFLTLTVDVAGTITLHKAAT